MICPKCKRPMSKHTPILQEHGILQEGNLCLNCGTWVEPVIMPKVPFNKDLMKSDRTQSSRLRKELEEAKKIVGAKKRFAKINKLRNELRRLEQLI